MQINAVSTNGTDFGNYTRLGSDRMEEFANADNKTLMQMSRIVASQQIDDRKHKRLHNAMWYSLPIAGGLASVVSNPVVGRIPKLKVFTKVAAAWAGKFALIDATWAVARGISNNSKAVHEFNEKHPIASTILTLGATVAALYGAGKGANWLVGKYGDKVVKYLKGKNVDKFIKENKTITKVMQTVRKAPSAIKEFSKGLIRWSPFIIVATSIGHTISHEKARAVAETRNFETLKANQEKVRMVLADRANILEQLDGE